MEHFDVHVLDTYWRHSSNDTVLLCPVCFIKMYSLLSIDATIHLPQSVYRPLYDILDINRIYTYNEITITQSLNVICYPSICSGIIHAY